MLTRTLEPELMDTAANADSYDRMDHASVNASFVGDLLRRLRLSDRRIPDQFNHDGTTDTK